MRPKSKPSTIGLMTLFLLTINISGCASDCSIMTRDSSLLCDLQMLPVIAVALPVAIAQRSNQSQRQADSSAKLLEGLKTKDRAALRKCLLGCWVVVQNASVDEKRELVLQAAKDFSVFDKDDLTSDDYLPMLIAHNILSIQKSNGGLYINSSSMLRASALSRNDEKISKIIGGESDIRYFVRESTLYAANEFVANVAKQKLANPEDGFAKCMLYMSELKHPLLDGKERLFASCSMAHQIYFDSATPDHLIDIWNEARAN